MEMLMDPAPSADALALAASVRDYLAETHGPDVLRRLDAGSRRDPAIWQGLVAMGLPGLLVPESAGGLGLGLVEAALIAAECGRACLAEPLVDTAFIAVPWLLADADHAVLADIASGNRTIPLPHAVNPWVSDGEGVGLESVDPLRRLTPAPAHVAADAVLLNLGALMTAAQLIGLAEAMQDQAVAYAKLREQFGQPIGAFQAIKHQLASCAVAIEFAKPVVWQAAAAMAAGRPSAAIHVGHAKLAAGDAAWAMAETAIQVHGAMGYTYEVDLHFWMKRTWALCGAWGNRAFHLARLDDAILGGSHPIGPEHTFT
ncbi:acyl-CoA dehydrogenase [Sandarakinorhabdus sp.]|jgi:alkylation response protein AidB-like acyl-CoA dehydrogenase|uniref:acyl-CoA dehydrogenase n=1 Tax=Sandarakinorhabdus sp. TaxID=1916663 RepID=UPI0028AD85AC|nr:acyl-CoA dehydrogenase [Sandarakinorhabdus sp.]